MCDKRAIYIGRQTEALSEIIYSPSPTPYPLEAGSSQDCLRLAALREKMSYREHCRSNIIKKIVELASKGKVKKAKRSGPHEPPTRNGNQVDRLFSTEAES